MNKNRGDVGSKAVVVEKIVEKKNWTKRGREEGEEKVAKLKKSEEERRRAMKSKSGELATRKML